MALFESYERRIDKVNAALKEYGISSCEEALKICEEKGFNPYNMVKEIQPIAFENACWAYTCGAAIAVKKGSNTAAEAAENIGIGLQAFCISGSVAEDRKVGLGHGNLGAMLLRDETKCFAFLAGHESFAAAEGAIGIVKNANKARQTPLRVILNGLGKDAAQIISRINGFTYVQTQFDYSSGEVKVVKEKAYSNGERANVRCYGADDVREGEFTMIKAIFFDIDGTLVSFKAHRISPAVLDGLYRLREKGIKLFIATGRQREAAEGAVGVFPFDGYITVSGQFCFAGDAVLRDNPIPPDRAAQLIGLLERTGSPCVFLEGMESRTVNPDARLELFPEQLNIPIPPVVPLREMLERKFYQAVAFCTREEQQAAGEDFFPGLDVLRWHPAFVDIVAPGGGKDLGMDVILDHFGIDLSETMAFGDGENDLPMLRHAGIGVAMGNAEQMVKDEAGYVTGSVDEDGILTALEHFELL